MSLFRRKPAPVLSAEWLIVGLGNPGAEYAGTRHNVGFEAVDLAAAKHGLKWTRGRRCWVASGTVGGHAVCLCKPTTYMNLSGQAVGPLLRSLGLRPSSLLVIADDLDLPLGKLRLRAKGGPGGHNGHRSLIASLQTSDYARLKVGIGKQGEAVEHVLSRFGVDEREAVDRALAKCAELVEGVVAEGVEASQRLLEGT